MQNQMENMKNLMKYWDRSIVDSELEPSNIMMCIYNLKPWQRFVPKFLYKLFRITPVVFENVKPVSIPEMTFTPEGITVEAKFSFLEYRNRK